MRHTTFLLLLALCLLPIIEGGGQFFPQFASQAYQSAVAATTAIGTDVLTVAAFDADPGDSVYYSIEPFPSDSYLTIDEKTGVIRTAKDFQNLSVNPLAFTVKARDRQDVNDPDVAVGTAQVLIYIINRPGQK